jgi:hypothetical protein
MRRRWLGIGSAALLGVGALALQVVATPTEPLRAQALVPTPGPYAGQQHSSVRGLTEEEIAGYREARGMGLARPADINGFPGPLHVLELADALELSDGQRGSVQALYEQMRADAVALGEEFLGQYGALELAFRDGTITPESLDQRAAELGRLDGALRAAHLRYHLLTKAVLTPEQLADYRRLRGYGDGDMPTEHRPTTPHGAGSSRHP